MILRDIKYSEIQKGHFGQGTGLECCAGERRQLFPFSSFWKFNGFFRGGAIFFNSNWFVFFFSKLGDWGILYSRACYFFCLSRIDSHLTNSNGYIYITIYFLFFSLCFGLKQEIYIHIIKYAELSFSICLIVLLKETFIDLLFGIYFLIWIY